MLILAMGLIGTVTGNTWAGSLADKKHDLSRTSERQAFSPSALDCGQVLELECGESSDSTNAGLASQIATYACVPYDESGGEVVYRVTLDKYTEITLRLDGMQADLDLFVLGSCSANDCIAASTGVSDEVIRRCLPPGTYYVVVDGYRGASSPFHLQLDCTSCVPCGPAVDNDTCASAADYSGQSSFEVQGNTKCAEDDYRDGTCTGYSAQGRDVVYSMSLPAGCTVQATLLDGPDGEPVDLSMMLVTSCLDLQGSCVAGADENPSGQENFTYQTAFDGTFYLIVDSFGFGTSGDYVLQVGITGCSVVGVESTPWSQLKSLYR